MLPQNTVPEAKKAQRDGIQIYAVGVDLGATEELFTIVSDRRNNVLLVPSFDHLLNHTEEFLNKLCKPLDNTIPFLSDAAGLPSDGLGLDGELFFSTPRSHGRITEEVLANADCKIWNQWLPIGVSTHPLRQHQRICNQICV